MKDDRHLWALVLAAGEGSRLAGLTTDAQGVAVPKQYCSLRGERSLLGEALARARRVVPRHRIVTVVAQQHARWWRRDLAHLDAANVIVQPRNRGTAPGILLPLLAILERDPQARVLVLPSDHHVRDEDALETSIRQAFDATDDGSGALTLLGITPDAAEPEYGWIVPGAGAARGATRRVRRFVEKPPAEQALALLACGAVWNSFLFAARGQALLALYAERLPELLSAFREAQVRGEGGFERLYATLPASDFSRDLLQGSEYALRLLAVPACGWTDLGTPRRVADCLARAPRAAAIGSRASWRLNLAERLAASLPQPTLAVA